METDTTLRAGPGRSGHPADEAWGQCLRSPRDRQRGPGLGCSHYCSITPPCCAPQLHPHSQTACPSGPALLSLSWLLCPNPGRALLPPSPPVFNTAVHTAGACGSWHLATITKGQRQIACGGWRCTMAHSSQLNEWCCSDAQSAWGQERQRGGARSKHCLPPDTAVIFCFLPS